jgi:integral membrane protein
MKNSVALLRTLSLVEGISFIVLVGIAMPLKYWAGMPLAVRIAGSLHGALFVLFGVALLWATLAARWPMSRAALVFVAALVPFAPLWLDRHLRRWSDEHAAASK